MKITINSRTMTIKDWVMEPDPMDTVPETCRVCTFFQQGAGANGRCHRFPPAFDAGRVDCFPLVSGHSWCGEFVYSQKAVDAYIAATDSRRAI